MDKRDVQTLRNLGLTRRTGAGLEGVRASLQFCREIDARSPNERRATLDMWSRDLAEKLARHGAEFIPGSLCWLGRTVEAIVPIAALDDIETELARHDVRLRPIMPVHLIETGLDGSAPTRAERPVAAH